MKKLKRFLSLFILHIFTIYITYMTGSWINQDTTGHFSLMQMNQGSHGPRILVNIAN